MQKNQTTRMKVFMDSEFTGLHQHTSLISIALVSEHGDVFYAEITDFEKWQCNEWLQENVLAHLVSAENMDDFHKTFEKGWKEKEGHLTFTACTVQMVYIPLVWWLQRLGNVEIWSDCLAYDWVPFCELFGGAMEIPENVYYIPFDLSTLLHVKGVDPDISREEFTKSTFIQAHQGLGKHNALWDVLVMRECYRELVGQQ